MNCIIIEDQLPAQRILKKYIEDTNSLNLVGTYTNALEAMQVLQTETIDLMFLDIHLPKISGIDFLKTLPKAPKVILTTAFQEYALESYEYTVVDYLLKPFSFQRFLQAISKIEIKTNSNVDSTQNQISTAAEEVYIKVGYDYIRIKTKDILYIRADSDYTEVHLKDKKYVSSESLRHWEEFLSDESFMRIHKSYMINTHTIQKVSGNQVFLENDLIVPLGRAFKTDFSMRFIK